MKFRDAFSAANVALDQRENPSNKIAYLGERFFPIARKNGIDLKWLKTYKGLGIALKPSALDALATIRPRGGFKSLQYQMPLFRESMMISEQDLSEISRAQDSTDPYVQPVLQHLYDDANTLIEGARISAERMRMSLLAPQNGSVVISAGMQDNTAYNYDYDPDGDWKAKHYMELTDTDKWDAPTTATPLNDLDEANEALANEGYSGMYLMMNSSTLVLLMQIEQLQKLNTIRQYGIASGFMNKDTAKSLIEANTGLVPIIYDKQYQDYDGTAKKYFPDGYVTIIAADKLGSTWVGVTPEERTLIDNPAVDVSVLESGIAIANKTDYGPPVMQSTTASMIALPSFEGMDAIYTIKVK